MTGKEVTPAELEHARSFLRMTQHQEIPPVFEIKLTDLEQLLAWYGAIRAHRAKPDKLINTSRPERTLEAKR